MLHGGIDLIDRRGVHGWVSDDRRPDEPLSLVVTVDDGAPLRVLANVYRADLEQAGYGNGRHGYAFELKALSPLDTHSVRIRHEDTSEDVPGSPRVLEAATRFDATLLDYLARVLPDADSDAELGRRAIFLAQQADRLLQARADRRANRPAASALRRFRVRWTGVGEEADPGPAPRALCIDEHIPNAGRDAGSAALISHMHSLQRLGFNVTVAASAMIGGDHVATLESAGISCCCRPLHGSVEEVLQREAGGFQLVYIHRATNVRYLPLVRHYQPKAFVVYSVADLHHLRLARQADAEQRPELMEASHRARAVELSATRAADCVITHSGVEQALLASAVPNARVFTVPWSMPCQPGSLPFEQRGGVALIGSYSHPPNLDAAWWLVQDVMPLVRARDPAITCILAGSDMPDGLRAVVSPGITAVGFVDQISSLLGQVRLTVAPLNFGAGIKGKVLDSLAAGIPCACTPIAAEGLDLPPPLDAMVGANAAQLAEIIVRLHNDARFNQACREAGLAFIASRNSEARVDELMRDALWKRSAVAAA